MTEKEYLNQKINAINEMEINSNVGSVGRVVSEICEILHELNERTMP
jgi:hypothetical protein